MAKTILIPATVSFLAAVLMSHLAKNDTILPGSPIEARAATARP